jgi:hypothetical protein
MEYYLVTRGNELHATAMMNSGNMLSKRQTTDYMIPFTAAPPYLPVLRL